MYVLVPMPCLFFGGGSTQFLTSWDGGGLVLLKLSPFNINIFFFSRCNLYPCINFVNETLIYMCMFSR